jgi:hypothetical protein
MADVNQILRVYGKHLRNNVRLKALAERAYSYKDAQEFATKTADVLCDVLKMYMDPATVTPEDAMQIFTAVVRRNYTEVAKICEQVQHKIYADAGVGLNAIAPEFNPEKARGLATAITDAEQVTDDFVRNMVVNSARSVVDEAIRINTEASENVGLTVHIKRRYDDIGLHNGKDVCQWCLDREGEWDNYEDAYNAGVFERHPGCGCTIEYEVGKTHTWSNSAGRWNDM